MGSAADTFTLQCASLGGSLRGHLDPDSGVASFRGVPYASVSQRWTHSTTTHTLPEAVFDATNYGWRCPQKDGLVLVSGGVHDPVPGDDEFRCLNLNIAVHNKHLDSSSSELLPVMVWIHGGAFVFGANSVARYRPQCFLQEAEKFGTPIVLVQINYRLGAFGFAASEDLFNESESAGNYGFVDQRNAFQWVHDHIADFGGDPSNVTAFGVSAGSASVHFHIITGEPLFDRGIMMSGAAGTLGPLPYPAYEAAWVDLCKSHQLESLSSSSRLSKLRQIDPMELASTYTSRAFGPLGGKRTSLPEKWTPESAVPRSRCKAIIVGDTNFEAVILAGLIRATPHTKLLTLADQHFGKDSPNFLTAFGLQDGITADAYEVAMTRLLSMVMFQHPSTLAALSFSKIGSAYLYHFEEPSPFQGPTFGRSYHGQCALYLHLNEKEAIPQSGTDTSRHMVQLWTAFAHGKTPWKSVNAECASPSFNRFGPGGVSDLFSYESDCTRDYTCLGWMESNFDATMVFVQKLLHPALANSGESL